MKNSLLIFALLLSCTDHSKPFFLKEASKACEKEEALTKANQKLTTSAIVTCLEHGHKGYKQIGFLECQGYVDNGDFCPGGTRLNIYSCEGYFVCE